MKAFILFFALHPFYCFILCVILAALLRKAVRRGYGGEGLYIVHFPSGRKSKAVTAEQAISCIKNHGGYAVKL